MANTFNLKIVGSRKTFFSGEAQSVTLPYIDGGSVTFLARHENTVMPVTAGELVIKPAEGEEIYAFVGGGYIEFLSNVATVVCVSVERPEDIDKNRAEEAKLRAEEELRQHQSQVDYYATKANLARAMERIKVKNRHEV